MSISYTQTEKKEAKEKGLNLVTIAVAGMEFQGPVDDEERNRLLHYLLDLQERLAAKHKDNTGAQPQRP